WKDFLKIPMADNLTTNIAGFNKSGDVLYLIDSRDRNTGALAALDLKSGKQSVLAEDPRSDAGSVLLHPTENTVQAAAFNYDRVHWTFKDPAVDADFKKLQKVANGDISVSSRTLDDKAWVVAFLMDNGPARFYLYDRSSGQVRFLFTHLKALEGQPLQR